MFRRVQAEELLASPGPPVTGEASHTLRAWVVALLVACCGAVADRVFAEAVPVGGEFQVNTYTTASQLRPSVAADTTGDFVVVWQSLNEDGASYGVFGRRYDSAGAAQGGEFQVNTYTTNIQAFPAVAASAAGAFVVVWHSNTQDGSSYGVFGRRYDSAGMAQGGEFQVNTYTSNIQRFPAVASNDAGAFVVVWSSFPQDGSSYGVFGRRYDSAGAAQGGEFQVNIYTTSTQFHPAVAADAAGDFVVVWQSSTQDGSSDGVFGRRYDSAGAAQGGEFQVNTYTTNIQRYPRVATDAAGAFVVVWASYLQDGSFFGVFGRRYASAGVAQGGEFQVNTHTLDRQYYPAVAADAAGAFVVVWQSLSQDGSSYGMFGRRYDSGGVAQGGEFQVNTYTTSDQILSAVAATAAGGFVVIWSSYTQDGSLFGVFGQRYAEPTDTPTATPTSTPTDTPSHTPTSTVTNTPTDTPTATPTGTGVPNGGACDDPADCMSGNCVDDVCCIAPSCPPGQSCDNPGNAGMCSADPTAPAPALSRRSLQLALALLVAVGGIAVLRRRRETRG